MTLIRRPTPFLDLASMRDVMERLFDDRLFRPIWVSDGERELPLALDVFTTPEMLVVKAALPGMKPEDVEITIADDLVTISGAYKEEKETAEEAGYIHKELSRGAFHRTFTAPVALKADQAKAVFKDGILTLSIPRAEESKARHIKVEAI